MRRFCFLLAPIVVAFSIVLGLALGGEIGPTGGVFETTDQFAMVGLGVLGAGVILLFARPKVEADSRHIMIQNVIGGYDLPWEVVRAVRFDRGSACMTLELEDDDTIMATAVQAADKEYAVESVRALRRLHAAARGTSTSP
ncbi:MAG TPA: PH domain-containing protein [Micromonosporaceae bacterium]|nr:PH domain-containing protein [Micromonosporaceae bacterium]